MLVSEGIDDAESELGREFLANHLEWASGRGRKLSRSVLREQLAGSSQYTLARARVCGLNVHVLIYHLAQHL